MKVAGSPALTPALSTEEATAIGAWGTNLEDYVPRKMYMKCGIVDKNDMCRVLDIKKSGGWLTSSAVDTYMSTLMPCLINADPGTERIFLPGFHSHQVEKYGTLGFDPEKSDDRESAKAIRRRASEVLASAEEAYVIYNVEVKHWALMRVRPKFGRCEIFDSTGWAVKMHGQKLLAAWQELTGVDTTTWRVVVYEKPWSGMAQQRDGKSCGVFACITAAHLVQDATLPDMQSEISAWRKHMAARITTIEPEPEPEAEAEPAQPQSLDEVAKAAEADDDFEDDFE